MAAEQSPRWCRPDVAGAVHGELEAGYAGSFDTLQGAGVSRLSRLSVQIRLSDAGYTGYGVTRHEGTKVGMAEKAECHDRGQILRIWVHRGVAAVPAWSFAGYRPDEVLGLRSKGSGWTFRRVRSGLDAIG